MIFLRKYGVALDASTRGSLKIRIPLVKRDETGFATSSDWTPAAGDVKVSKDFGAEANVATLPTYANNAWEFTLSATELAAKTVGVRIDDAAVELLGFAVETFGHPSAAHAFDLADADALGIGRLDASMSSRHASGAAVASVTGAVGSVTSAVIVGTNNDKSGYSLAATGLDLVVATATGAVAIATAARDAILNRVLAGNHDGAGSTGKLLQDGAAAAISADAKLTTDRLDKISNLLAAGSYSTFDPDSDEVANVGTVGVLNAIAAGERILLAAAIEAAILNDGDSNAVLQAIADKFADEFDVEELTLAAIAAACRDAILDRVVAGNHVTPDSVAQLLLAAKNDAASAASSSATAATQATTAATQSTAAASSAASADAKIGSPAGGTLAAAIAEVKADTASLLASLAEKFLGMTSLAAWLRTLAGASVDATALSEIEAGGGDFDPATHSLVEIGDTAAAAAIDAGDAASSSATAATQATSAASSAASADAKIGSPAGGTLAAAIASVKTETASILSSLGSTFAGMTSLPAWLRTIAGASTDATALSEIEAGGGDFDPATDSLVELAASVAEVLAAVQAIDPPTTAEIVAAMEGGGTKLEALHATLASSGVFASAAFANLTVSGGFSTDDRTKLTELAAMLQASGVLSAAAFANLPVPADAATLAKQTEILEAVLALSLDAGSGANVVSFVVQGEDGEPVAGVLVTLRKSGSPAERYSQLTDADGIVTFALDSGEWLRSLYKAGLSHTPDSVDVAGDLPAGADPRPVVSMDSIASAPPSSPGLVTAQLLAVGGTGTATIRLKTPPEGSGSGFNSKARTVSPTAGVWYWPDCAPGGEYEIKLGSSSSWYPQTFTIPADQVGPFDIDNVLGILEDL